jgi:NADH dehydrogenase
MKSCIKKNIQKLIHISAIGVNKSKTSKYAITKLKAEKNIKKVQNSIIIRPSIVYGYEDKFLNFFANYARFSPFLPLIGGGKTQFQPILVSDLVQIITGCINKQFQSGQIIEAGGPDTLSFKEILTFILNELKLKRYFINLPFNLASKLAFFLERLPVQLITRDQVEMLKTDNIVNKKKSHKNFLKYECTSFFIAAKKQLKFYKKNGGH